MQTMGSVNTVCSNGKIILAIFVNFFRAVFGILRPHNDDALQK